jgi:uncharacterized protein YutE (UPF0331/DUF86 family)
MSAPSDISSKLEHLGRDCARLETHRQLSLQEFLADTTIQEETCYLLFTAYQNALDIAARLLDVVDLPEPDRAANAFTLLGAEEVLTETCVSQLTAMDGLCTSISQQYEKIDPQWVYQALQVNLTGLNEFARQVRAYLDQ